MEAMRKVTEYKGSGLKWKIAVALLIILLAAAAYLFFMPKEPKELYRYVTQPLAKGDLTLSVSATGYLEPVENVEVGTEVSGTIDAVYVDYNDIVKKGEPLARLDKTKYQSALSKAEASLNAAKASLQNMRAKI